LPKEAIDMRKLSVPKEPDKGEDFISFMKKTMTKEEKS